MLLHTLSLICFTLELEKHIESWKSKLWLHGVWIFFNFIMLALTPTSSDGTQKKEHLLMVWSCQRMKNAHVLCMAFNGSDSHNLQNRTLSLKLFHHFWVYHPWIFKANECLLFFLFSFFLSWSLYDELFLIFFCSFNPVDGKFLFQCYWQCGHNIIWWIFQCHDMHK